MKKKITKITVIDYGVGNLLSVTRGIEKCGAEVNLTNSASEISQAERLILPGVGAFKDGMNGLKEKCLIEPIESFVKKGRPFLGICLGMQMILDKSEEFGIYDGLGFISGSVIPIPRTSKDGYPHKIPHIGWNNLEPCYKESDWQGTVLEKVKPGESVYFVHSFYAKPTKDEHVLAQCDYNGRSLSAVVFFENIYGCQFHPEKSGPVGLRILDSFCNSSMI